MITPAIRFVLLGLSIASATVSSLMLVSTAPRNSPSLVEIPRFGLVGRVLIATAVQISMEEGFRGRIGRHALPQAETFYAQKCGMTDMGNDERKEDLRYFEMTPNRPQLSFAEWSMKSVRCQ